MRLGPCFECNKPAECDHHVVPRVKGGTKTVPLCLECHGKVHGIDAVRFKALQRIGIAQAKARGAYKGRRTGTPKADKLRARQLRNEGNKPEEIANALGISERTAFRYLA